MRLLVRLTRVLLLLVLVGLALSFVIAIARPETGPVEKLVLAALVAGSVWLAARVSTLATVVDARLSPH